MIEILRADITTLDVDAVVTAANSGLAGGGGVDGAIHRAAGPELARASRSLAPCPPGDAVITSGFRLRARYVIHAVGPVWTDGESGEPELLRSAYDRSFALARAQGDVTSIAFPALGTGVGGFPLDEAAQLTVATVRDELPGAPSVQHVVFALRGAAAYEAFSAALSVPAALGGTARSSASTQAGDGAA